MTFLQAEKKHQTEWKLKTKYLSREAKKPGLYRSRLYPFCFPIDYAQENLYEPIREQVIQYFKNQNIYWHSAALPDSPSNHLCSSQVFCINVLFPFAREKEALKQLLSPAFPDIETMLPIEKHGNYLSFEWIPPRNYLGEKLHTGAMRRGIGNTSIDFACLFQDSQEKTTLILGEMKYSEHYHQAQQRIPRHKSMKIDLYRPFYYDDSTPFLNGEPDMFESFSQEPFYQLLRQQLLARQIELHHPGTIDQVVILYLYTAKNRGLINTHPRGVVNNSRTMFDVWKSFLKVPESIIPFDVSTLISESEISKQAEYLPWYDYLSERYRFLNV